MDFQTAVRTCFEKYATIAGRARRSEYWWFALFLLIGNLVAGLLDSVVFSDLQVLSTVFALGTLVPSICAGVRRLHDTGRSGWWMLLMFIPLIGFLVLLYWFVQKGTDGPNEFGPDPLAGEPA